MIGSLKGEKEGRLGQEREGKVSSNVIDCRFWANTPTGLNAVATCDFWGNILTSEWQAGIIFCLVCVSGPLDRWGLALRWTVEEMESAGSSIFQLQYLF